MQDVLKISRVEKTPVTPCAFWGAGEMNDQRVAAAKYPMNVGD